MRQVRHVDHDGFWNRSHHDARRHLTDRQSQSGTDETGREILQQELAQDTRACSAQSGAQGELRGALDVPRQHEQSEIRAHDHQEKRHRDEQSGQGRLHGAEEHVAQGHRLDRASRQRIGVFARQVRHHVSELSLGARG